MIAAAQRGSEHSVQELVLHHIGFVIFRLHRKVFPDLLRRFGEELLSEAIPILYAKIQTYDPTWRGIAEGDPGPCGASLRLTDRWWDDLAYCDKPG